ncbi:MAG: histidine kinase [Lewinellaceae bacterium]|nr:histidine kinase [Lewinellaceae bacterium]
MVIFAFLSNFLFSQMTTLDIRNGLPSNNVYVLKQDSKGFIWGTTDKGVFRYDGKNFKYFTSDNGLGDNDNFGMLIDSKDNIWLCSQKSIQIIQPNGLIKNITNVHPYFSQFLINDNDEVYYRDYEPINRLYKYLILTYPSKNTLNSSDKNGLQNIEQELVYYYVFNYNNAFFATKYDVSSDSLFLFQLSKNKNFRLDQGLIPHINIIEINSSTPEMYKIRNVVYVLIGSYNYRISKNGIVLPQHNYPNNSKTITNTNILIIDSCAYIPLNNGIFKLNALTEKFEKFLPINNATTLLVDHEGNLWVSTLGDGIYLYKRWATENNNLYPKIITNDIIQKIDGIGPNNIWVANEQKTVYNLNKTKTYKNPYLIDLRFLKFDDSDVYFGGSNELHKNGRKIGDKGFKSLSIYEDTLVVSSSFGIDFINKRDPSYLSEYKVSNFFLSGRYYATSLQQDRIYCGNQNGLFFYARNGTLVKEIKLDQFKSISVIDIKEDQNKSLWVTTDGLGIFKLEDDSVVARFTDELLDNNINSIKIDNKNRIWVATNKGLNKIEESVKGQYKVTSYTTFHGLISNFIFDIYCFDDDLYLATDKGLIKYNVNYFENAASNVPPSVYIRNARSTSDNSTLRLDSLTTLKYNQNSILIEFAGISYNNNNDLTYQYRLLPLSSEWRRSDNTEITFENLKPSNYTFEVQALFPFGGKSIQPATLNFTIKPHFTSEIWFLALCGLSLLSIVYLSIRFYFRRRERIILEKNSIERKISELRLQSLQAQMNPHFIFNCLNTIQQFVNKEDKTAANDYLAKFAFLVRNYLNSSDSQFITLDKELEILKIYIELEHMRFHDKFTFEITVQPDVDTSSYKIPALLLQPYVENAIKHGLLLNQKTQNNKLSISINKHGEAIKCSILDNGIGRVNSRIINENKKLIYKSMGTQISNQRIELIRSMKLGYITENIIDLYDENNEACGTLVELIISHEKITK